MKPTSDSNEYCMDAGVGDCLRKKKRKIELCTKVTEEEKWKLALRPREESKIHLMGCASGYDLWV